MRKTIFTLSAVCAVLLLHSIALAQPQRPGDRLRQLDANGDGLIAAEEIPEKFRKFILGRARDNGVDTSRPVPVEQLVSAVSNPESYPSAEGKQAEQESARREDDEPLVPGFGEESDLPTVPGFGVAEEEESSRKVRAGGVPVEDRYSSRVRGYVEGILRRYDRNNDNQIDESESKAMRWRSDPKPSDLNNDGLLSREELLQRVSKYSEFKSSSDDRSSSSRSSRDSDRDRQKYQDYARGLLKRYDNNRNGVLEKDEWSRMSSFHRGADANNDNVITTDELATRLSSYGKDRSSSSGSSSNSSSRSSSTKQASESYVVRNEDLESYRAKTATERLPSGLPDWFARNDKNGDGQISMAEFAVSWTDDKLEEFQQYDANRDGIITSRECTGKKPTESKSRYPTSRFRRR